MIDVDIVLYSNGGADANAITESGDSIYFGYAKNANIYRLRVHPTGIWEGLAVRAFYHPNGDKPPAQLCVDNYIPVPSLITANPGDGIIVFEGTNGTQVVTSANVKYHVSENAGIEDGDTPNPGTPAWVQLIETVGAEAKSAKESADRAQSALDELLRGIREGKFEGSEGPQGPAGPQGPVGPQGVLGFLQQPSSSDWNNLDNPGIYELSTGNTTNYPGTEIDKWILLVLTVGGTWITQLAFPVGITATFFYQRESTVKSGTYHSWGAWNKLS